ncbi:ComEC/Rec2 family competence protein, partial [PVC group bacterium]|nr:ComEC/Rec2 family competence protein [PVC group bacterium]
MSQSFVGISWGLLFLIITLLGQWVQKKSLPSTHVSLFFGWMTGMIRGGLFDQPATQAPIDLWVAVTSRFEMVHHVIKEKLLLGADDIGAGYQIVLAMLLGERSMIPQDILQDFIQTGTMHILAISGLHFVLIGTIIYQAAWYLTRRRISASWITLAFICFYVILVGERPSVFRAGIMMAVYIGADIVSRRPHTMNALALAAFLILMVKPDELSHAGFQLSFLSVFGIIRVYPWMKNMSLPFFHSLELAGSHSKWKRRGKDLAGKTLNMFLISCAIFLVIFPISMTHFNQLSFISVFANVLIVPLAGLSLTLGFTGLVFSFLFPIVSSLFFLSCGFVMNIVMFIAKGLSGWPGAYMEFAKTPGPMTLLSYYACLLGVVEYSNIKKILKKWKTKHVVIWFLVGMNIWIWTDLFWRHTVHSDHLQIHMFNVAQGESILIETPDQKYILIDGGDRDDQFDCGERIIAPYLKRKRIPRI